MLAGNQQQQQQQQVDGARSQQVDGGAEVSEGPPAPAQQRVTLTTFRQLMDLLAEQKAQMEALLAHRDVSIVQVAVGHFKDAVIPSPTRCLEEMHAMLPALAADLFHGFMSTVQNALSRLQVRWGGPCMRLGSVPEKREEARAGEDTAVCTLL